MGGGGVQSRGGRGGGHRSYHPLINATARRTLIIVPEFSSVFVDILIIITSHYVSAVVNSLMYTVCGLTVSTDTFITDLSVMILVYYSFVLKSLYSVFSSDLIFRNLFGMITTIKLKIYLLHLALLLR